MAKNSTNTNYFYNVEHKYIYSGEMQEGDRVATSEEVKYWNEYHSTIEVDKEAKNKENIQAYTVALNRPLAVGDKFVLADWITTYSNTYTLAKKITEEGSEVSKNIVVLNAQGKLETVTISSLEDFEPYYKAVSDEWARIIDIRNNYMVEIQNSKAPKGIVITY